MNINPNLTDNSQIAFFSNKNDSFSKLEIEKSQVSHSILNDFFYLEYVLCPPSAYDIKVNIHDMEGFYFIYCWEGNLSFSMKGDKVRYLVPYQSALAYDIRSKGMVFHIDELEKCRFGIIGFNKAQHLKNNFEASFYYNFKKKFLDHMSEGSFVFKGRPYLRLLEKINMLSAISLEKVPSEFIMEGVIFQILGIKMEQLLEVVRNKAMDREFLTEREMTKVHYISDFIRENPSFEFTIDYLCRETGFSPSKLQEAFKRIHGRTVIDFIRNVRLEAALQLIKTTDMNISEIVYSIGLTSRSYFSKIFKNKYKCSPKTFQEQIRLEFMGS